MKKIFIIDNLNSIVDYYSDFLRLKGYDIAVATSVEDFFERLNDFNPDLVIYDTDMPLQESKKFTKYVFTFSGLLPAPILFLTGFKNEEKLENFKIIRNSSFLSKDSSNSKILKSIKMLVDNFKNKLDSPLTNTAQNIEQSTIYNH